LSQDNPQTQKTARKRLYWRNKGLKSRMSKASMEELREMPRNKGKVLVEPGLPSQDERLGRKIGRKGLHTKRTMCARTINFR
jgi:hypothetical protein